MPNKFSPPVLREMLREHSVENIYVYVRVWRTNSQYKEPIKSQQEKKIPCAVQENTKLFYFCLFGWKGSTTFLGQQQSEVKQNKWI